jgi:hypothetical protein
MFSKFGNFLTKDREYRNKIFISIYLFFTVWWNFAPKKNAKIGLYILVKKFTHKCDQTIVLGYTTH